MQIQGVSTFRKSDSIMKWNLVVPLIRLLLLFVALNMLEMMADNIDELKLH